MDRENDSKRRRYLEAIHGIPFSKGNRIQVLRNGDEIFPAMLAAIDAAQVTINFLTYVYWSGNCAQKFSDHLAQRAREGIQVRVLLDAYGSKSMPKDCVRRMEEAGVEVLWFRPMSRARPWNLDNRTHRKVLVCDDRVAFTGGVGVAREWEGNARNPDEWRDTHFEFHGPAVHGINGAFWGNWLEADRSPPGEAATPSRGADPVDGNSHVQIIQSSAARHFSNAAVSIMTLIDMAEACLRICTPYLVLDKKFLRLLCQKSEGGVDIDIIIPGPHIDKRFEHWTAEKNFQALLDAGIRIHRYQPTMIHTKLIIVDSDLACVGSPNLNQRSMRKDDELIAHIQDRKLVSLLVEHFEDDLAASKRVENTDWCGNRFIDFLKRFSLRPFREQL